MKKCIRSTSRVALILVLICFLLLSPNTAAFEGFIRVSANSTADQDPVWPATPFLNDTFENDTLGQPPANWFISGNISFLVDNSTAFSGSKCARILADMPLGSSSPFAYRFPEEHGGIIVIIFAIRVANVNESFAGIEVSVDDDHFNGSNVIFASDRTIRYREKDEADPVLIRNYYALDRWYKIEFIMNIPENYYQIHIDDHVEIINANYTGPITSVHRIAVRPLAPGNCSAYIDEVIGYDCVRVPEDFPTIQEAIDHAIPGIGVFVSPGRTYFENIVINKSLELIGSSNVARAIIDGHFNVSGQGYSNGITITGRSEELEPVNVTASSYTSEHPPKLAIDGDPSSYWNSADKVPQWLMLDLGSSVTIAKVATHFPEVNARSYTYCIEVSKNKSSWTKIVSQQTRSGLVIDTFPQIEARFVRITITHNTADQWAHIKEIKVYSPGSGANVQIHGFIIQNSNSDGIHVDGSNIKIFNNIINNTGTDSPQSTNSGHGIYISGFKNLIENNTVTRSLNAGVYLQCSNSTVKSNMFVSNFFGVKCGPSAEENSIFQNLFIGNTYQGLPESDEHLINRWDNGYPYVPGGDGGGNYWSDFESTDTAQGPDQTEFGYDGICDTPRGNRTRGATYGQDNYPLFLTQSVRQYPARPNYTDTVTIFGRVLYYMPGLFGRVFVNFTYDSNITNESFPIIFLGQNWSATISAKRYCTSVEYSVSIRAPYPISVNLTTYSAWANSTTCLKDSIFDRARYHVGDGAPPVITLIPPAQVYVGQLINVTARVTEDLNASGVDRVFLSWVDGATRNVWNGTMTMIFPDVYSTLVPKQYEKQNLTGVVYAYDKAGNSARSGNFSIPVLNLPNMVVRNSARNPPAEDPCIVDFEVLSRGATSTTSNVTITNNGEATLGWNLTYLDPLGGSWLTVSPSNGLFTIPPGNAVTLTIRVDTSGLKEPCNYVGKLWIQGNGTTSQWGLVVSVKTRYVVIDDAYGSSFAPNRCNVSDTQNFGYHVIWAHDSSDATTGSLTIGVNSTTSTAPGPKTVNGTGWAPWTYSSSKSANLAFPITTASFTYVDPTNGKSYTITNFTIKATVLNTIWDRVNITITIPDDRIDVCTDANPSVKAVYETDGLIFRGNVTLSPTVYCGVSPNNRTGERIAGIPDNITAVDIIDPQYHLKAFSSNIVTCVWDRIRILAGGVARSTVNVKEAGTFWVIVVYEWDNQMFKGWYPSPIHMGQIFVDVYDGNNVKILEGVPMNWSSERERWEYSVAFDSAGTRTFVVSGVSDYQYDLSKVKNSVEPLSITWGQTWWNWWTLPSTQTSTVQNQNPSSNSSSEATWQQNQFASTEIAPQLWVFIVAVLVISCISVTMFWVLGTKKNRKKRRPGI